MAWRRPRGSRCGGRSPPLRRQRAASTSSSPAWTRPGCWCASGSASQSPGQVTGYSVALPGDTTKDGGPVWYGGGKLAADLSWPKLRQRWTPTRAAPGRPHLNLTAEERNAVWDHATRAAADAAAQIRTLAWTDPAAAADAAWATSDTLHVAAAMLGSRILRQAADAYDRAARPPYGRIPPPTPAGNQLRQAARLLSAFACLTGDRSLTPIVLITRLAALAEAVAELRDTQQHAAQAAAARAAAEQLHAAARPAPPAQPRPVPARQHRRPARRAVLPPASPASDATSDTRTTRSGSRRTTTSATAATTEATRPHPLTMRARTAQRIRYMTPAPECHATPGESILRHLASAGCCMPFRCGVSATLTLAPGPPGVATPIGAWPPPAHVTDGDGRPRSGARDPPDVTGNLVADMAALCCAKPDDLYTAIRGPMADPRPDLPNSGRCVPAYLCPDLYVANGGGTVNSALSFVSGRALPNMRG